MSSLASITPDTTDFPWQHRTPVEGLISTLAVAVALVLGHATGHPAAGAVVAAAAFMAGFAAFNPVVGSPLWSMVITTLGLATATAIGSLCAQSTALTILVAVIAAFNYAVLWHLTPSAGFVGQQCAVMAIVAGYFPGGAHFALGRLSLTLLGGAIQLVIHVLFTLGRSPESIRSALHAPLFTRGTKLLLTVRDTTLSSADTISYAIRLVIALVLCTALYRHDHVRNGYWIPMTAVLVLKPTWPATLSRGIARMVGTVLGATVALLVGLAYPVPPLLLAVLALIAAFACYTLQSVNYASFSFSITLYIVFIFAFGGFSEHDAAHLRLINTAMGGAIALLLDGAWFLLAGRRGASAEAGEAAGP